MMKAPQRPVGPRSLPGKSEPPASPAAPAAAEGSHLAPPTLGGPRRSRPSTPRMKLGLSIPVKGARTMGQDSPSDDPYDPSAHLASLAVSSRPNPPDDATIKPLSSSTELPPRTKANEPLEELRQLLIDLEKSDNRPVADVPAVSSEDEGQKQMDDEIRAPAPPPLSFADEDLLEVGRLGEGAGGAVHKVQDKRTNVFMARKTITTREAPLKQLLREVLFISSTTHPNIITFYGAYMSPSSSEVKILMELCEGGSLEAIGAKIRERGGVVSEKIAGRIAEGVLQGLAYLHTKRTIHRDIKPSNILLSRQGIVKLVDFGVSGELVGSNAGTFTGTSFYMAPERITGSTQYTIRSDVWSTGISLLELVQNRFPYPTDLGPIDLMMYITSSDPPRLEDENDVHWSEEMKDFVSKTLTLDPQKRPIPREMLEHPWIQRIMKEEVKMTKWIAQVWGWQKSNGSRRPRDPSHQSSRHSSTHSSTRASLEA